MTSKKKQFIIAVEEQDDIYRVATLDPRTRTKVVEVKEVEKGEHPVNLTVLFLDEVTAIMKTTGLDAEQMKVWCEGVGAAQFVEAASSFPDIPVALYDRNAMSTVARWINENKLRAREARFFPVDEDITEKIKSQNRVYEIHVDGSAILTELDEEGGNSHFGDEGGVYHYGVVCAMGGQRKVTCFSDTQRANAGWTSNHFEFDGAIRAMGSMYRNFRAQQNPGDVMTIRLYCDNKTAIDMVRALRKMPMRMRKDFVNDYLGTDYSAKGMLGMFFDRNVFFELVEWEEGHSTNALNIVADSAARAERHRASGSMSETDYARVLEKYKDDARQHCFEADPKFLNRPIYLVPAEDVAEIITTVEIAA